MTPKSRNDCLLTQPVGDELVIYDERSHAAHRLNTTAAHVWRLADGERSLQDLAVDLRESLGADVTTTPIDAAQSEELVRLALTELSRAGLLVRPLAALGEPMTRREMLVVTAALVPVVASIVAPTPAMAQTIPRTTTTTTTVPPTTPGFRVSVSASYRHISPGASQTCAEVLTDPPQPGGTYSITWSGPGIVGPATRTGSLDTNGRFFDRQAINAFGNYTFNVTVTSGTVAQSPGNVIVVTEAPGTCPAP